jgi:CubicO group peptidase (beta-lactamase class C family)
MKRFLIILFLVLAQKTFSQQDSIPAFIRDSLDNYVKKALTDWQIPGVSVCIVKNGKVVMMKGYGTTEAGKKDPVDENTLFMIGSNTKAFTATALALLDAEKKVSLDDKVQKWLPDFKQYDPWVTKEMIIRDLLCHRLGFETFQGDFMFFDSDLTLAQVREKFGKIKPLYSFRSRWGYCNAAFMTAGELIPKISGKSWADFIKERIFLPLGMNRTLALTRDISAASNKATAHTVVHGILKKIPYGQIDNLAPAGSISSSINDMSKWILMLLNNGMYNGKEIIPASAISKTRTPASILGNGGTLYNKGHFALYGLGWFLQEYNGRKIVEHTGGVNGFVTSVALVPEEQLGIVILTNTDANNFYEALRWEILDAYLELPYRNYSNAYLGFQKANNLEIEKALKAKRDTINMKLKTDLPLADYAGNYTHPIYGKMVLKMENGKLVARFEHHKSRYAELDPLGRSRFLAEFNDPLFGIKVWPFTLANGKVKSVTVRVADFVEFTPYEFVKTGNQ